MLKTKLYVPIVFSFLFLIGFYQVQELFPPSLNYVSLGLMFLCLILTILTSVISVKEVKFEENRIAKAVLYLTNTFTFGYAMFYLIFLSIIGIIVLQEK